MKKSLVVLVVGAVFTQFIPQAHAMVDVGLLGGLGISKPSGSTGSVAQLSSGEAFGGGAFLQLTPGAIPLAVEFDTMVMPRAWKATGNAITQELEYTTFQLAALARYTGFPFVTIGAGMYGTWALGNLTSKINGQATFVSLASAGLEGSDYGLIGSITGMLPLTSVVSIGLDLRHLHGLKDVALGTNADLKASDFQTLFRLQFSLGGDGDSSEE